MKILLDECVPWPRVGYSLNIRSQAYKRQGWSGIHNSELLGRAEADFDHI
jgi:hypothetical protein